MGGLQYAIFIVPILLFLAFLEYLVSRKRGVEAYRFSDTIVNMMCGMLERLFDFFWVVMMYFVFVFLYEEVALWQFARHPLTWVGALFVADLLAYWHHRLSHEINFLWASHIVHHQSEELNITTVFRVSAFAVINRSFFFIWMPLMGFDPVITTSAIVFIGLFQFVTHTRLVGKLGWLEYFFVTPSHHRVHHARNEKYLDKNYGHVFIIWDRMFGTFVEEEEEPDYGITTGFESSNPYRAYFFYWVDLFRRAREAKSWGDKVRIFLKPPSWNPEGVTVTPIEYKVDAEGKRQHYILDMPARLQIYILVNVLLTLGVFLALVAYKNQMVDPTVMRLLADPKVLILGTYLGLAAFAFGLLMERRPRGLVFEYIRLAFTAVVLPVLLWNLPWSGLLITAALLFNGFMAFWMIRMRNYFPSRSRSQVPAEVQKDAGPVNKKPAVPV